ncbi:N-acetylmuramoyl-L-alanine amidase [Vagococcus fluvialis]|uniref:N-acetylmuramoyl-L-alanine amidase n=1 Tax=Vagococcus fluvialis TaxID=2738 RepID=UPI001D09F92D|nr:N-acetylmuramoyl-L-alanine amidase [Vagococcus fluvialis]UDM70654.1 N-acetylmuramoyl-L-alanine amidase [Vagococcus fluvialis]UDM78073.1 N-acetylmuramoyl-L-alanine amidase [Vagococcus fluvialis]UDM82342.1 N-acetylmuramoyl-L-alanine amidase [Vagococcus fluvialis]
MGKNTIHAGHGGKGSPALPMDPGALEPGGTTEHAEMLWVTKEMLKITKWLDVTDQSGTNVNNNLYNIVNSINRVADWANINISNHMNAFNRKATGVEVWYYLGDPNGRALAEKLSAAISKALGLPNRGAKATTDLYVIRETIGLTVLPEWAFIDNPEDMKKWRAHKHEAVNAALEVLGYKEGANVSKPKPNTKLYHDSGVFFKAKRDLPTYTDDNFSKKSEWVLAKGSVFGIKSIYVGKNGNTHALVDVNFGGTVRVTLNKDWVEKIK